MVFWAHFGPKNGGLGLTKSINMQYFHLNSNKSSVAIVKVIYLVDWNCYLAFKAPFIAIFTSENFRGQYGGWVF